MIIDCSLFNGGLNIMITEVSPVLLLCMLAKMLLKLSFDDNLVVCLKAERR